MDSSNNMVDSGGVLHEFIEVDNFKDDGVGVTCWEPEMDMCFSSMDDAKSFYGEYAMRKGFGWKIRTSKKGQDGKICYIILACTREGSKVSKVQPTLKTLPTRMNCCPAKICIKMEKDGLWYFKKFNPEHSHEIIPTNARLFKANKKMKRTIKINDDAGRHENILFCERDVKSYVNQERRAIGKEDQFNSNLPHSMEV
ncbi:hypothetical protein P8452_62945 [Trifolium repens]|nr:hypothetical protein P8452_62945 [Trifolium repens]